MARIRSLKPSIWTDDKFIQLSLQARLLCIGMISNADDEGRIIASGAALVGTIYPHDDVKLRDVERWRDEIASIGLIVVYSAGRATYAAFPQWRKHQRIQKPQVSTLPKPPESRTHSATESRTQSHTESPTHSDTEGEGDKEKDTEREEEWGGTTDVDPFTHPLPDTVPDDPVDALVREHVTHFTSPPPPDAVVAVKRAVLRLVRAGQRPEHIRLGLARMRERQVSPRLLGELTAEAMPKTNGNGASRPSTTDQRVRDARNVAAELRAQGM